MLAETYRPQRFENVIGHEKAIRLMTWHLDRCEEHGKAFLVTGPSGIGKTTIAECAAEYWGIARFGRIKIESATCTVERLERLAGDMHTYGPPPTGRKLYLIDEVHTITGRAADRMLSLLEELPSHVLLIGTTTETGWTDGTLLSRWVRFDLGKIPSETVAEHLARIALAENLPIPADPAWARKMTKYDGLNLRNLINQLPERLFSMAG